ncbi:SDR family NAD(P)-dependent oxidoreductase [Noviherbaspirillum cavernae]|uniref:SDR family NAD(P)-dependent oxidoreductase n=1 Tax=Noviherbaspirillum cavernae TaxID=2320862 RepID=A0A418X2R0_9BURK|nr:SDR family NAD(P)-dependent oxidoreductase [Noviherbaspirillum cavernae]RJG06715.1 SDR family NAD(P)-dependent oxidoreductase [Noviherbaspirillum cavernae]
MNASETASVSVKSEELSGKAILVTGGASGLGAALCEVLSDAGARVMVADLDHDRAVRVADRLHADAIALDVGDPAAAEMAVEASVRQFGKLDVLINNAGVDVTCSLEDLSISDWERVIRTNLHGPFLMSRFAARRMRQAGHGHIVNIASTAAKRAWPNAAAYHASKWGLLGLSHALHAELRPFNIKVTAVIAGGMRTPFLLDRFPDIDITTLQEPANVARAVKSVLTLPDETVISEIMVLPMRETSWP